MTVMTTRSVLAVAVLLSFGAQVAAAPGKPSPADMAKAREHFKRAHTYHESGQYDEAIREYEAAFALAELPELLYNLGQVHRLRGDKPAALANYRRYLEAAPTGRGADKARQFVAELALDLEQQSLLESRTVDDASDGAAYGVAAAVPAPPPPPMAVLPPVAPPAAHDEPPPGDRGRGLRIAGLATGGAGVLLLGGAGFFALRGSSLKGDQDGATVFEPSLVDDGKAANRNAIICGVAGGAALVTGGVLYYLGRRRESRVVALPMAGPGAAGLMVWATY